MSEQTIACPDCGKAYGEGDTVIVARGYSWCPACSDVGVFPSQGKLQPSTILGERPDGVSAGVGLEAKVERLKRERRHFARMAWWFCEHEPGTPVPEWCELAWCAGEPIVDDDTLEVSEAEEEAFWVASEAKYGDAAETEGANDGDEFPERSEP